MKKGTKLAMVALAATFSLASFASCGILGGIIEGAIEDVGTESLKFTVEESQKKIQDMSKSGGLEITVKFVAKENGNSEEDSSLTFGVKDNVYWSVESSDSGMAYAIGEDKSSVYFYDYDGESWIYNYTYKMTDDEGASMDRYFGLSTWLYFGHVYDGMLKESGTTKIAGRDCIVYKYSMNLIVEKLEYTLIVDKETGVTMKYDMGVRVAGESAAAGFEVTSFKTGNVTAPRLPAPEVEE